MGRGLTELDFATGFNPCLLAVLVTLRTRDWLRYAEVFLISKACNSGMQACYPKMVKPVTCLLRRTLVDIKVASCVNLDAAATLRALESIQQKIKRLHLDYIWKKSDNLGHDFLNFDLNASAGGKPNFFIEPILDVCKNVSEISFTLEMLSSKCLNLKVVMLGQFQRICLTIGSRLDVIALCHKFQPLFEIQGCKLVTEKGLKTMTCLLRRTLIGVKVASCANLDATATLKALEPIKDKIERLTWIVFGRKMITLDIVYSTFT
ncbi:hypothetical protein KIW84_030650 [Lathyrus oleraceus]|uniref:Uncharacterized protein n=1 Tax=Pisum sativum TaxID=3888 RepID=A0A9D5AZ92_PEA|nr:hypothetical protein KIW84_030650 [Pisum sativum]